MTVAMPYPTLPTRRPRRLGIEAHTEFVATLIAELRSSVTSLKADPLGGADFDRRAGDVVRLVRLLDAIDGPWSPGRLQPISLPFAVVEAVKDLGLPATVSGQWGEEQFVGIPEAVQTGIELLLLALSAGEAPVSVRIGDDRTVVIDGTMDLADPRRNWQLRCARRVLEGERCRVRLNPVGGGFRVELRVLR